MRIRIHQNRRMLRTSNPALAKVIHQLCAEGYNVRKRGWPELLISKGNRVEFVYIKKQNKELSENKTEVLILLQRAGMVVRVIEVEGFGAA